MYFLKEMKKQVKESRYPFYIYILHRPNLTPFYVGKGKVVKKDARVSWHEYEAALDKPPSSNPHWNALKVNTIRKIWRQGENVRYLIDSWHQEESSAYFREVELIKNIGRKIVGSGCLTNITEGGEKETATLPFETRRKISVSLKQYYEEHPEAIEELSRRGKDQFNDPEAVEQARQRAIENKSHEAIIRWLKEEPEACREKWDKHSDYMKQWHKDNPEKVKNMVDNRNRVLKSEGHRSKMAERTKQYMRDNPDVAAARAQVMRKATDDKVCVRNQCLRLVQEKLFQLGKISEKKPSVSHKMVYRWRQRGLIQKFFPEMPFGQSNESEWSCFKQLLKTT